MQSVLSVPLIVTEQSFTASLLIKVSCTATSSGIGRNIHGRGWDFSYNFPQCFYCVFFFFGALQAEDTSTNPSIKREHATQVFMSATTWQSSMLNNKWGGGFWGVVDCLPLFVWIAELISGDYIHSISRKLHIWTDKNKLPHTLGA